MGLVSSSVGTVPSSSHHGPISASSGSPGPKKGAESLLHLRGKGQGSELAEAPMPGESRDWPGSHLGLGNPVRPEGLRPSKMPARQAVQS